MIYDVIVVGAGPAGTSASIYAKRANLNVLLIEKEIFGGQVVNAGVIENYPGIKEIKGFELAIKFKEHVDSAEVETVKGQVLKIEKSNDLFTVHLKDKKFLSKTILIATGAKPRALNLENEEKILGSGIYYCAYCDGGFFKNKDVAIAGGGVAACEAALYLSDIAKKVYVFNLDDKLKGEKITTDLILKNKKIQVINNSKIVSYIIKDNNLEALEYQEKNDLKKIQVEGLFVYIGRIPDTSFLDKSLLDKNGYLIVDSFNNSKLKGLFGAGDCTNNKIKQITTAVASGSIAAISLNNYLKNNK